MLRFVMIAALSAVTAGCTFDIRAEGPEATAEFTAPWRIVAGCALEAAETALETSDVERKDYDQASRSTIQIIVAQTGQPVLQIDIAERDGRTTMASFVHDNIWGTHEDWAREITTGTAACVSASAGQQSG